MTTEWLDDAFGPDAVRVTICVEPDVERLVRARNSIDPPNVHLLFESAHAASRTAFAQSLQDGPLKGRYAVVIEADSGERHRILRPNHDEAVTVAKATWHAVTDQGVAALADVT